MFRTPPSGPRAICRLQLWVNPALALSSLSPLPVLYDFKSFRKRSQESIPASGTRSFARRRQLRDARRMAHMVEAAARVSPNTVSNCLITRIQRASYSLQPVIRLQSSTPSVNAPWSINEVRRLRELAAQHVSLEMVAHALRRTPSAIRNKATLHGISIRSSVSNPPRRSSGIGKGGNSEEYDAKC